MEADADTRLNGIYVDHLERIIWVLREKYPRVLAANRRFEEETCFENKLGANNLNDALSHIGTLVTEAPDLDYGQQAGQVTLFEDHLRRSMMEAWEQMLEFQLGEIDELWPAYLQKARPLQVQQKLPGIPTAHEIDRLRIRHKHLLEDGREAKRAGDWPGWEKGTDCLIEACETASELRQAVEQSIAGAKSYRRDWWRDKRNVLLVLLGMVISAVLAIGIAIYDNMQDDSTEQAPTRQQPQDRAP